MPTGTLLGAGSDRICTIINTGLQAGGSATCQGLTVLTVSHRRLDIERSKPLKRLMPANYEGTGLKVGVNESSGSQARHDARRNAVAAGEYGGQYGSDKPAMAEVNALGYRVASS